MAHANPKTGLFAVLAATAFAGALWFGAPMSVKADEKAKPKQATQEAIRMEPKKEYSKPTQTELRKNLTAIQYGVTQKCGTEPAFSNEFWDNHKDGLYVDVTTGEPLFSSLDKFNSGTGWPSFTRPIDSGSVKTESDESHGMQRNEVRSRIGDAHLGHVFDDGPAPTGQRFCINSASLRFIPKEKLAEAGYGKYAKLFEGKEKH
jgi:methionine-R-sulfoxide reductase